MVFYFMLKFIISGLIENNYLIYILKLIIQKFFRVKYDEFYFDFILNI